MGNYETIITTHADHTSNPAKSLGLNDNELVTYSLMTGFSRRAVVEYYHSFIVDCPDGKLSRFI
jgi:hypothetical protein